MNDDLQVNILKFTLQKKIVVRYSIIIESCWLLLSNKAPPHTLKTLIR